MANDGLTQEDLQDLESYNPPTPRQPAPVSQPDPLANLPPEDAQFLERLKQFYDQGGHPSQLPPADLQRAKAIHARATGKQNA